MAIANEAERKNQNMLGQKILRTLRKSALEAFTIKNPTHGLFDWHEVHHFSWVEEDAIESARATMAIPITGGSLLLLALVSLNYFHRTFSREKNDQARPWRKWLKRPSHCHTASNHAGKSFAEPLCDSIPQVVLGQGRTSPGLETSSTMTPPLSGQVAILTDHSDGKGHGPVKAFG